MIRVALLVGTTMLAASGVPPARDQPRLDGLVRWGHEIVAVGNPLRRIDPVRASAEPIVVPTLDEVDSVAGDTTRYALGKRQSALTLVREAHGGWEDVTLPPTFAAAPLSASLGATGEELGIVEVSRLSAAAPLLTVFHFRHAGAWKRVALEDGPAGPPQHLLFVGNRWLLGSSRGEWGGELWSVTVEGGVATVPDLHNLPVNGIVATRAGRVFVGFGQGHMDLREARVVELTENGPRTRVETDRQKGSRGEWAFPVDSLEGLAVDVRDQLYALTGHHGVVRLPGGEALPGWPGGLDYPNGLLLDGDHAVVSTFDSGVFLFPLGAGAGTRIPLTR